MKPAFFLLFVFVAVDLSAQFSRIAVNDAVIDQFGITKAAGDNDFVVVDDGELYHVTFNGSNDIITRIENSIINISDIVMYDVDRDMDLDVIAYAASGDDFHVYLKTDGIYRYHPEYNIERSSPHFLHAQDLDDDGFEDLMINHHIYRNTGVNEYEQIFRYPVSNNWYYKYAHFLDFENDNDPDVLLLQVNRLWILQNRDPQTNGLSYSIPETNNRTEWAQVIQTTEGEKIIYYDGIADQVREVVLNDSSYTIQVLMDFGFAGGQEWITVEDLDDDENEEIILYTSNDRSIHVFKYDLDGDSMTVKTTNQVGNASIIGLMELAGETALYTSNATKSSLYTFNEDFSVEFVSESFTNVEGGHDHFKDFDGDGFTDVIDNTKIKRYLGDREFEGIRTFQYPDFGGNLEDYDMDGDQDYVTEDSWYENIGDFSFSDEKDLLDLDTLTPEPDIFFTLELLRADIDEDGDIDILTYNYFGEPLQLLENDNNIDFLDPVSIATVQHISGDAVLADVLDMDRDGINDIVLVAHSGIVLIKGRGSLNFDDPIQLYDGNYTVFNAEIADMNNDTFPDLLVGTRDIVTGVAVGEAILYLGNDNVPSQRILSADRGYHRVGFANIDQEGWLDIVYNKDAGLYWRSTEDGQNFTTNYIDVNRFDNAWIAIADVDSDDDDDIITYQNSGSAINYYLNGDSTTSTGQCPVGSVYLRDQFQVNQFALDYGLCEEIDGDLFIGRSVNDWSDITDISALQNLRKINGDLTLHLNNLLPDLIGLSSLTHVGGDFIVDGHKSTSFAGMENLSYVGGDFDFNNVATVGSNRADLHEFESLDTIMGDVRMLRSNVSSLATVAQPVFYGNVSLEYMGQLDSMSGFSIVDSIYGFLQIRSSGLRTLDGLEDLEYLYSLYLRDNSINDYDGLNRIKHVPGDVEIRENQLANGIDSTLTDLETIGGNLKLTMGGCGSFKKLQSVGGDFLSVVRNISPTSFNELTTVGGNFSILVYTGDDFNLFSNLSKIGGQLSITNNEVTSLFGLHNVDSLGEFSIANNRKLRDLLDLNDELFVADNWRISGNDVLNYCNVDPLCRHIEDGRPYEIFDNGFECQDISDIRCIENAFSGFVFHDFNENGSLDVNEATLSNVVVISNTTGDTFLTSNNGFYRINARPGDSLNVEVVIPADFTLSTVDNYVVDSFMLGAPNNYGNNFGLVPDFDVRQTEGYITSSRFVCDREYELSILIDNIGSQIESGYFKLYYPAESTLDSDFTDFIAHDVDNHILTISFDTIYPFFNREFIIPFTAPSVDLDNSEHMTALDIISTLDDEEVIFETSIIDTLLCAYDPNDKLVRSSNGTADLYFENGDELIYTIRFQNTGNFFAEDVRIKDTLNDLLDPSTLRFIASSHEVEIELDGHEIAFNFYDIQLPDSARDFLGSQGYVTFAISPISNIRLEDVVRNKAGIFFDYNPAIITNTVRSRVVDPTYTIDYKMENSWQLYPVPASDLLFISFEDGSPDGLGFAIYDLHSKLIDRGVYRGLGIDVSNLYPGSYLLQLTDDEEAVGVRMFVVQR